MATTTRPAPLLSPVTRVAIAAVGAYVGAQVIADITSLKIGSFAGRAVDMGTFIYPITFTLRDVVHKALGKQAARTLVLTAAAVNVAMALYLQWAAAAPSDASYPLGAEFQAVLAPLWRITVASILAEVVSELVDTEVYHWFIRRVTTRHQWARVAVSNAVSVPIDNVIFAVGAFGAIPGLRDHALTLPWSVVGEIFLVNLSVKALVSALSLPLIYVTPDREWSAEEPASDRSRRRRSGSAGSRSRRGWRPRGR
ncbi:MAG: queuosine precursor transporter [Acidimicrobiales bacterium]